MKRKRLSVKSPDLKVIVIAHKKAKRKTRSNLMGSTGSNLRVYDKISFLRHLSGVCRTIITFCYPMQIKKRPLPVLLDSGLRLYGFVDIDSAFELELDIVFSFDLYAVG